MIHLPPGAVNLTSNAFLSVQAVAITLKGGVMWAVQYHPEYDLRELSRRPYCRIEKLVGMRFFRDREAAEDYIAKLEALHQAPSSGNLAWLLGMDGDMMNEDVRLTEVRNWIDQLVLPTVRR